ncbi:MAG: hypothetical protein KJ051_09850 [Thermoleophilia bacterium]|nr:hypothetical protein [Thermoleophilia bacterium]
MEGLHSIIGLVAVAANAGAAGLGGIHAWRRLEPPRLFAHLLALGQTLLVAQAALGLLLLSGSHRAPDQLHYVYGGLALGAVLSPWVYAPREGRGRVLWFVAAALLAAALALRAYTTGG